jgi:nucleotide-binding universal stress UspA family protein
MGRIVVGVDGSEDSKHALAWAANEAALRGASLDVVHVFEYNLGWANFGVDESMSGAEVAAVREAIEQSARDAAEQAEALIEGLVAELAIDGVEVTTEVVEANRPAQELIDRSRGADLLVVGSRGRGGFRSLMLGSVSQQCATHAECPVAIIRSQRDGD